MEVGRMSVVRIWEVPAKGMELVRVRCGGVEGVVWGWKWFGLWLSGLWCEEGVAAWSDGCWCRLSHVKPQGNTASSGQKGRQAQRQERRQVSRQAGN